MTQLLVYFPLAATSQFSEQPCPLERKRVLAQDLADPPRGNACFLGHRANPARNGRQNDFRRLEPLESS